MRGAGVSSRVTRNLKPSSARPWRPSPPSGARRLDFGQPEHDLAEALVRLATRVETGKRALMEPNEIFALVGAFRLITDAAERKSRRNGLVGGGGDRDSDH